MCIVDTGVDTGVILNNSTLLVSEKCPRLDGLLVAIVHTGIVHTGIVHTAIGDTPSDESVGRKCTGGEPPVSPSDRFCPARYTCVKRHRNVNECIQCIPQCSQSTAPEHPQVYILTVIRVVTI